VKSRNNVLLSKSKTFDDRPEVVEESLNNISEIQTEAKIQVPTRFRSRESMMKFTPDSKIKVKEAPSKPREPLNLINIKDMHLTSPFGVVSETPVRVVKNHTNESTRMDAESVLKLLRTSKPDAE
jgi:hypothetical protein